MQLKHLPEGAVFFPPRTTTHFVASYRVWGCGPHGVFVQERLRVRRREGHGTYEWGPAVEWSGEILVEVADVEQMKRQARLDYLRRRGVT